jgi:hypothetical protein
VLAFIVSGAGLVVAALVALLIPGRVNPAGARLHETHPGLSAEAEAIVGAIAVGPEDLA